MKIKLIIVIIASALTGCNNEPDEADAYGNFEATEVLVSAETSGRILRLDVKEGIDIKEGDSIALIDTTLFHLQKK